LQFWQPVAQALQTWKLWTQELALWKAKLLLHLLTLLLLKPLLLKLLQKLLLLKLLLTVLLNMLKTPTANWTVCSKNHNTNKHYCCC